MGAGVLRQTEGEAEQRPSGPMPAALPERSAVLDDAMDSYVAMTFKLGETFTFCELF